MLKKNFKMAFLLAFSLTSAQPSYAWNSESSFWENALAVLGLGAYVSMAIAETAYNKIRKKIGLGTLSEEEGKLKAFKESLGKALASMKQQIENHLRMGDREKNYAGFNQLLRFIEEMQEEIKSPDFKEATILCRFKERFLPGFVGELHIDMLAKWLDSHTKSSKVPDDFITKTKEQFSMDEEDAKFLFGMVVFSLKHGGIKLSIRDPRLHG